MVGAQFSQEMDVQPKKYTKGISIAYVSGDRTYLYFLNFSKKREFQ